MVFLERKYVRIPHTALPVCVALSPHIRCCREESKPVIVRLPSQAKKVKLRLEIRFSSRPRNPLAVHAPVLSIGTDQLATASRY
jgi:hypothetical protein